jgi:hypothetical protein
MCRAVFIRASREQWDDTPNAAVVQDDGVKYGDSFVYTTSPLTSCSATASGNAVALGWIGYDALPG